MSYLNVFIYKRRYIAARYLFLLDMARFKDTAVWIVVCSCPVNSVLAVTIESLIISLWSAADHVLLAESLKTPVEDQCQGIIEDFN